MQAKPIPPVALAAAMSIALAHAVHAEIIYSQTTPEEPVAAFGSSNFDGLGVIGDNFLFTGIGPKTVRTIRLIGTPLITNSNVDLPTNSFRIVFLEDDSGLPGDPIPGGEFSVAESLLQDPTGGELLNGLFIPIEYTVDLGAGIELETDTEYWISVSNIANGDRNWAWARANGELDQEFATTVDVEGLPTWVLSSSGGGMWFELRTTNIPEPKSILLCCVAAFVLAICAIRRSLHTLPECKR